MMWGIRFYNDLLMQAGPLGNVQSELLFKRHQATVTFDKGWAFPRRIQLPAQILEKKKEGLDIDIRVGQF